MEKRPSLGFRPQLRLLARAFDRLLKRSNAPIPCCRRCAVVFIERLHLASQIVAFGKEWKKIRGLQWLVLAINSLSSLPPPNQRIRCNERAGGTAGTVISTDLQCKVYFLCSSCAFATLLFVCSGLLGFVFFNMHFERVCGIVSISIHSRWLFGMFVWSREKAGLGGAFRGRYLLFSNQIYINFYTFV